MQLKRINCSYLEIPSAAALMSHMFLQWPSPTLNKLTNILEWTLLAPSFVRLGGKCPYPETVTQVPLSLLS